jgi:DNA-binding NarL/FixJ family response regulator
VVTSDAARDDASRARVLLHGLPSRSAPRLTRVILAEDQALVREALTLLLQQHNEVEIVGAASTGREAVDLSERLAPDVILMDLVMPGMNGIEASRQIRRRSPGARIILLTAHIEQEQIVEALRAGVLGCVVKRSDSSELMLAIQTVRRGNPYISEALSSGRTAFEYFMDAKQESVSSDPLTAREREILQLIAEGHQNQAIADELVISVKTVEAHKAHIKSKLRAQSDMDLFLHAMRRGLITLDDRRAAPQ